MAKKENKEALNDELLNMDALIKRENRLLLSAAISGDVEGVLSALQSGADVNTRGGLGDTALMYAARDGNCRCIALLIERGAIINLQNDNGITALHQSAIEGKLDALSILLDAGADIAILSNAGNSAKCFAKEWLDPSLRIDWARERYQQCFDILVAHEIKKQLLLDLGLVPTIVNNANQPNSDAYGGIRL